MGLQISEAELERRRLVASLKGRFFSGTGLTHRVKFAHADRPRLPLVTLPETGSIPLRSDRPFVVNPARTDLRVSPR